MGFSPQRDVKDKLQRCLSHSPYLYPSLALRDIIFMALSYNPLDLSFALFAIITICFFFKDDNPYNNYSKDYILLQNEFKLTSYKQFSQRSNLS